MGANKHEGKDIGLYDTVLILHLVLLNLIIVIIVIFTTVVP